MGPHPLFYPQLWQNVVDAGSCVVCTMLVERLISIAVGISLGSTGLGWVKGILEIWRGIIVAVCPNWDISVF